MKPTRLCECGCGLPTMIQRDRVRFLPGHNAKLFTRTEEHRRRIGEANKKAWAKKKVPGFKFCPGCKQLRPSAEFGWRMTSGVRATKGPYLRSRCLACEREYQKQARAKDPERSRASQRKSRFYVEHGIRESDYLELLDRQQHRCAICGKHEDEVALAGKRKSRLCVDHCHSTKEIRGLLCDPCNRMIGFAGDQPKRLVRAADYLLTARTGKVSQSRRGRRRSGEVTPAGYSARLQAIEKAS